MFETKAGVLLIGGLGFFLFAFLSNAVVPMLMYRDLPEQTVHESVNANVMYQFEDLKRRYPEAFAKYYGEASEEKCAEAPAARPRDLHRRRLLALPQPVRAARLQRVAPLGAGGQDRGISKRAAAAGDVRHAPRRTRPEPRRRPPLQRLARGAFLQPTLVSTGSPMPEYPWFFDGDPNKPNDAWPGDHHVRAVAGLVAGKLSVLRELPTD